jgi:hypothetical protein
MRRESSIAALALASSVRFPPPGGGNRTLGWPHSAERRVVDRHIRHIARCGARCGARCRSRGRPRRRRLRSGRSPHRGSASTGPRWERVGTTHRARGIREPRPAPCASAVCEPPARARATRYEAESLARSESGPSANRFFGRASADHATFRSTTPWHLPKRLRVGKQRFESLDDVVAPGPNLAQGTQDVLLRDPAMRREVVAVGISPEARVVDRKIVGWPVFEGSRGELCE